MEKLKLLSCVLMVLALSGLVFAAANDKGVDGTTDTTTTEPVKQQTYGQCVVANADIKNTCYSTVKSTYKTCTDQAAQDATTKKDAAKACKATYKKDMTQCKATFKASKKECAKIKHNFLETLRYSLK